MSRQDYLELLAFLKQHLAVFQDDIAQQIRDDRDLRAEAQRRREAEQVGDDFESEWIPRLARRNAVSIILRTLILRVLEDRGLLPNRRVGGTTVSELFRETFPMLGSRDELRLALREGWRVLPDLFSDDFADATLPGDEPCRAFLAGWRLPDPDDQHRLLYDFRQPGGHDPIALDPKGKGEPAGYDTRFIGDIYQGLDSETVSRYALCQTPSFIATYILDHTLAEAFEERRLDEITLLDPTCGSGHFLLDAFWYFVRAYQRQDRESAADRLQLFRRIVENHLFGADIVPLSCELARLRLLLAGVDLVGLSALEQHSPDDCPLSALEDLHFNIVCCDSLLPYERMADTIRLPGTVSETEQASHEVARTRMLGEDEQQRAARGLFSMKHTVCVGNPPYVTCDNSRKRDLYRTGAYSDDAGTEHRPAPGWGGYVSAHREFQLGAPFTERFFEAVASGGWVGLINSNAFARRSFGKKLVEETLAGLDVRKLVDCGGVFIPGHGTPTIILVGRNRRPSDERIRVLSCLKGEPTTPERPEEGIVWRELQEVDRGLGDEDFIETEFAAAAWRRRPVFAEHPWTFGGRSALLLTQISNGCGENRVSEHAVALGTAALTRADEIFIIPTDAIRRNARVGVVGHGFIVGEQVRDWLLDQGAALAPYDADYEPVDLKQYPSVEAFLRHWQHLLAQRVAYGKTQLEHGLPWFVYNMLFTKRLVTPHFLTFAEIATHNHFVPVSGELLFNRTAPIIKLPDDAPFSDYVRLAGILNSSTACFCLKQVAPDKGANRDKTISTPDPVTYRYVLNAAAVGLTPLPDLKTQVVRRLTALATEATHLGDRLARSHPREILAGPNAPYRGWFERLRGYRAPDVDLMLDWANGGDLRSARTLALEQCQALRARLVYLQEEIDWLAYHAYGLIDDPTGLTPEVDLTPTLGLDPDDRPFRLLAEGRAIPDDWPDWQRELWQRRLQAIADHDDLALIEDPVYKRRWQPPKWDDEFTAALEDWLLEKVEHVLEHWRGRSYATGRPAGDSYVPYGDEPPGPEETAWLLSNASAAEPVHISEIVARVEQDPRALAVLNVLAGGDAFDTAEMLLPLLEKASVPACERTMFKDSGLRKLESWGTPWKLTDEEAAKAPKPPEFKSADHRLSHTWSLRGKLNVPRERFIHYVEYEPGWFGWAGWDPRQRAEALDTLLQRAQGQENNVYALCGLRIPLRRILTQEQIVKVDHPEPSCSPLPPCQVDRELWSDLEWQAKGCNRGLESECACREYLQYEADQPSRPTKTRKAKPKTTPATVATVDEATIRETILAVIASAGSATRAELKAELPQAPDAAVDAALAALRDAGQVELTGAGRSARYRRRAQIGFDFDA